MFFALDNFFRGMITDLGLIKSLSALQLGQQYVAVMQFVLKRKFQFHIWNEDFCKISARKIEQREFRWQMISAKTIDVKDCFLMR